MNQGPRRPGESDKSDAGRNPHREPDKALMHRAGDGRDPSAPMSFGDSHVLFQRCQAGDQQARNALLAGYEEALRRYASMQLGAHLRTAEDTADVVHGVVADALERLEHLQYEGKGSLLGYLKTCALNRVKSLARKQQAASIDLDHARDTQWLNLMPAKDESVSAGVERDELRAILDECMIRLPDRDREILASRKIFGASWDEIAAEMNFPTREAASQAYQRAKNRLMEHAGPRLRGWIGDA